jgi:hypothetical protein
MMLVFVGMFFGNADAFAQERADKIYTEGGVVGVAKHQAMRFNLSNVATEQCDAELRFVGVDGRVVMAIKVVVGPEETASQTFTPSRLREGEVVQLRPVIISIADSCTAFLSSLEVVNTRTGQTDLIRGGPSPEG